MTDLRVRPRPWIGVAIALGYVLLVAGVQRVTGVPYRDLGDSASTLFRGAGIPLLIGTVVLAGVTTALGWWRPALRDAEPSSVRWPIVAPALLGVLVVADLAAVDWPAYGLPFLGASVALLLVGFTEEIAARGLLITALRARLPEGWVWFLSTLVFALMHLVNILSGLTPAETVVQAVNAFLFGTALYILRRVSGTLLRCMVLHAGWDFSLLALGRGTPAAYAGWTPLLEVPIGLFALIAVRWVATSPRAARIGS